MDSVIGKDTWNFGGYVLGGKIQVVRASPQSHLHVVLGALSRQS